MCVQKTDNILKVIDELEFGQTFAMLITLPVAINQNRFLNQCQ